LNHDSKDCPTRKRRDSSGALDSGATDHFLPTSY
jgi:hypothetical protein